LRYIEQIDSLLIVSTAQDPLIKVYDKNYNYLAGFGQTGRGPNEFISPPLVRDLIKEDPSIIIFTYHQNLVKRLGIDLWASMESNQIIIDRNYELPIELRGSFEIFSVNDTTIMGVYDRSFL
jgi:hypothetical protein